MTGTYCYKRPNGYAHCWHEDKLLHTMNPPQRLEAMLLVQGNSTGPGGA
jgi:hypothetical protein